MKMPEHEKWKTEAKEGAATMLAIIQKRLAELQERRNAFELKVKERRRLFEEEESMLRKQKEEAWEALLLQRRQVFEKIRHLLPQEYPLEGDPMSLIGDTAKWRNFLSSLAGMDNTYKAMTSPEEIKRLMP